MGFSSPHTQSCQRWFYYGRMEATRREKYHRSLFKGVLMVDDQMNQFKEQVEIILQKIRDPNNFGRFLAVQMGIDEIDYADGISATIQAQLSSNADLARCHCGHSYANHLFSVHHSSVTGRLECFNCVCHDYDHYRGFFVPPEVMAVETELPDVFLFFIVNYGDVIND